MNRAGGCARSDVSEPLGALVAAGPAVSLVSGAGCCLTGSCSGPSSLGWEVMRVWLSLCACCDDSEWSGQAGTHPLRDLGLDHVDTGL